jgi:hyperosmotically inducible protein
MGHRVSNWISASAFSLMLFTSLLARQEATNLDGKQQATLKLAREVRKQIVTVPQYGVFDSIHFALKGNTVILRGQASRPILKSAVENAVKRIEGVESVENQIQVLPLSPNDDRIRAAVYASIYRYSTLQVASRTILLSVITLSTLSLETAT